MCHHVGFRDVMSLSRQKCDLNFEIMEISVMMMTYMTILTCLKILMTMDNLLTTSMTIYNPGSRREGPTTGPYTNWLISYSSINPFVNIIIVVDFTFINCHSIKITIKLVITISGNCRLGDKIAGHLCHWR